MKFKYHHIGLPTIEKKNGEEYNKEFKYFASGYFDSEYGIEWLRFNKDCDLHPLIQKVPHVSFSVDSIDEAIKGRKIILKPYSPVNGVTVSFVVIDGAPVEFLQFDKPEEKVWGKNNKIKGLEFHHLGIKGDVPHKNAIHIPHLKIKCTDHESNPFGLQWMYYENNAPYPELVKSETHIAFKVKDINTALIDKKVIIEPNSPSTGITVAFIEENGAPIEFLEYR